MFYNLAAQTYCGGSCGRAEVQLCGFAQDYYKIGNPFLILRPDVDLSSLHTVMSGAAPLNEQFKQPTIPSPSHSLTEVGIMGTVTNGE